MPDDTPNEIIDYWFGADDQPNTKLWFQNSPALDEELRARFGDLHQRAANGELRGWLDSTGGAAALLVILDQFSRNLYRGDAKMFAWDSPAQEAARVVLRDVSAPPRYKAAANLCLMHSEDTKIAAEALEGFSFLLKDTATRKHRKVYKNLHYSAQKHLRVLERFGRYPHRNALLGRETTSEEATYLSQENSRFAHSVKPHAAKRLKILVLHSFRQSGQRLASRMGLLQKSIEDIAELVYLDAPHAYKPDTTEKTLLEEDFGAVPDFEKQRCWWNAGVNHQTYEGWEASLRFLDAKLKELGPVDGVLGFSQGSAATGLLAALRPGKLRFVICISGFPSRDEAHQMLMQPQSIEVPSLHIYGEKDILVDNHRTLALANCFLNAEVCSHPGGHFFPELLPMADIRRFLLRFTEAPSQAREQLTQGVWESALRADEEDPAALPSIDEIQGMLPAEPSALLALLLEARSLRQKVGYGAGDELHTPQPGDFAHRIWLAAWQAAPEIFSQALAQDEGWRPLVRLCVCAAALLKEPQALIEAVAKRFASQLKDDEASHRLSLASVAAPRPDSATDNVTGLGRAIATALRPELTSPATYIEYRRRLSRLSQAARLARRPRQKRGVIPPSLKTSSEVARPRPVPVIPCALEELNPLLSHLENNIAVISPSRFSRGTVMPDGRLDLCKQVVGPEGIGPLLKALGGNPFVDRLLLGNNIVGRSGASQIASFIRQRNSNIKVWYIAGNEIDATALQPICEALREAPEVTGLWLKRNPLGPEAGAVLGGLLRANTNIDTLDLVNTGLFDGGALDLMKALYENQNLKHLYLSTNGLTEKTAAAVGRYLAEVDRLESLYLSCNPIGDEGAKAIAAGLATSKALKRLGLASNRIGPEGTDALCGALEKNTSLRSLDLGWSRATSAVGEAGNSLGDKGAARLGRLLQNNHTLRALDISNNSISQAGLNEISDALDKNQELVFFRFPQYGKAMNPDSIARLQGKLVRNRSRWGFDESELDRLRVPQSTFEILSVYRTQPLDH